MLEYRLLMLFGLCAALVLISGFVTVKFYRSGEKPCCPVIAIPLTPDAESVEFIVRNCVYPVADKCPGALAAAIDFGAGSETVRIFEKLMERSCRYEIINLEECSKNICKIVKDML